MAGSDSVAGRKTRRTGSPETPDAAADRSPAGSADRTGFAARAQRPTTFGEPDQGERAAGGERAACRRTRPLAALAECRRRR